MTRPHAPAHLKAYLKLVRASAWYDLAVTAGFATPWTFALLHDALSSFSTALGWDSLPTPDTWQTLYANLMGSVVIIWSALRIARPLPLHGLLDGIARTLFSTWMAYALAQGASQILWLFLAAEVTWGVVQMAPWCRGARRPAPFADLG